jgi:hypothetical protein
MMRSTRSVSDYVLMYKLSGHTRTCVELDLCVSHPKIELT